MRSFIGAVLAVFLLTAANPASARDDRALFSPDEMAAILAHSPLGPPPADPTDRVADDVGAAAFGKHLFFDQNLSPGGDVSCATCHQPAHAFTDGRKLAKGVGLGTRNTPTVLNAAFGHWFFLDGRTDSLWAQALQPMENPREYGGDRLFVLHAVNRDPALRTRYRRLFGPLPPLNDAVRFPARARPGADAPAAVRSAWTQMAPADRTAANRAFANLGKAIEAFERTLISDDSPFDRYVKGLLTGNARLQSAISPAAKRGLRLFVGSARCVLCHSGPDFTDGQFHNLGLPVLPGEAADAGRADGIRVVLADPFNGAGRFSDSPSGQANDRLDFLPAPHSQLGAFKTPSLRNVALTGPYMHDGRFSTLAQVLDFYAKGKAASHGRVVGKRESTADLIPRLTSEQQADIIAFLKTLSAAPTGSTPRGVNP